MLFDMMNKYLIILIFIYKMVSVYKASRTSIGCEEGYLWRQINHYVTCYRKTCHKSLFEIQANKHVTNQ